MADAKTKTKLLPVQDGEEPWSEEEVAEVRAELESELDRIGEALKAAKEQLAGLLTTGQDRTGRDPADVGSSNFERDQGVALAQNTQELYDQLKLALNLFDKGKYGYCENCGQPIGKARLQVFPRATMCVKCKQREERR